MSPMKGAFCVFDTKAICRPCYAHFLKGESSLQMARCQWLAVLGVRREYFPLDEQRSQARDTLGTHLTFE